MGKYQSTKLFDGFSVAIRQHKAQHSHCCLNHGYSIYFVVTFEADSLDEMNWIADFGCFKRNGLKDWLADMFDHTQLIEKDDPMLDYFKMMEVERICNLRILDAMGCESLAKLVSDKFNDVFSKTEGGRIRIVKVECFEHAKNSGIYME